MTAPVLVVLPSYNESANIVNLIEAILALGPQYRVCVVDDSSPDGTADKVRQFQQSQSELNQRLHLIVRSKKDGRGGAVREGFAWGVQSGQGFQVFVEMDCDFSHEPKSIPIGVKMVQEGHDLVMGSRYPDGTIEGWPLKRKVLSFCANTLARALIDWRVKDYTNGFRFYSPVAVQELLRHKQIHKGYIYLSESLSQLLRAGMKVGSFPIYFKNRERGVSNTNFSEVFSAFRGIFEIAWEHHFSKK